MAGFGCSVYAYGMFEVAGGIALFILGFLALQVLYVAVMSIYHGINDWYYQQARRMLQKRSPRPGPLL